MLGNDEFVFSLGDNAISNQCKNIAPIDISTSDSLTVDVEDKENYSINTHHPSKIDDIASCKEILSARNSSISSKDECHSGDESSSSCDEYRSDTDESPSNAHMSVYERLRLRNIRRNEARLAKLGLLLPQNHPLPKSVGTRETSSFVFNKSAFSDLLSSGKKRGRPRGSSKKPNSSTRNQPRRRAKANRKYEYLSSKTSSTTSKFTVIRHKKGILPPNTVVAVANEEDDDDDVSLPPSPIQLSKIIKPQPHQKDFHEEKKFYLKQRRNRRGRPKREEYIYVCEEICGHCGGSWGHVKDAKNFSHARSSPITQDAANDVIPIPVEYLNDDEVKLIRCKDCRGAFHPRCMLLNGKSESTNKTEVKSVEFTQEIGDKSNSVQDSGDHVAALARENQSFTMYSRQGVPESGNTFQSCHLSSDVTSFSLPNRCKQCAAVRQSAIHLETEEKCKSNEAIGNSETLSKKHCHNEVVASTGKSMNRHRLITQASVHTIPDSKTKKRRKNSHSQDLEICKKGPSSARSSKINSQAMLGKRKTQGRPANDATAKIIRRIISKAVSHSSDRSIQKLSISALQKYIDGYNSTSVVVREGGIGVFTQAMANHDVSEIQVECLKSLVQIVWYCERHTVDVINQKGLELAVAAMDLHEDNSELQKQACELFRALSYDLECCNAMFDADIVRKVISTMIRNRKDINILAEGSFFIQNMTVVSSATTKFLMKPSRLHNYPDTVSVMLDALREHNDYVDFVASASDILETVALDKKGLSMIDRSDGDLAFQELLKTTRDPQVMRSSIRILSRLSHKRSAPCTFFAEAGCVSHISSCLRSVRDPTLCTELFTFMSELAMIHDRSIKDMITSGYISLALDAIQDYPHSLDLQLAAFSVLRLITTAVDKQLSMTFAKTILDSMANFPDDEAIQSDGCHLLNIPTPSRGIKGLLRAGRGKIILTNAIRAFPESCAVVRTLLCDQK